MTLLRPRLQSRDKVRRTTFDSFASGTPHYRQPKDFLPRSEIGPAWGLSTRIIYQAVVLRSYYPQKSCSDDYASKAYPRRSSDKSVPAAQVIRRRKTHGGRRGVVAA